ncbi:histidine kinase [Paucibacter sp. AS339]|uniref:sensor histidine kinase n=1 Tax=Paucibacter hankyongi TaxID=3133434 RepID=UPI0030B30D1A
MDQRIVKPQDPPEQAQRRFWLAYAGSCLLSWTLYILAGTDYQRGPWVLWSAIYEATLTLWAPMLLGTAVWPWMRWMQRHELSLPGQLVLHGLAALLFSALWLGADVALAGALFGAEHAWATLEQAAAWRVITGVFVYVPLATGFAAVLNARRARASAVAAAQAESALARAELAAISGKLNPHFLFNTLNSLIALTRKDAKAAEQALMRFSDMLRYVLASKRGSADRVSLREELDFVRDYLALESLRLGARLQLSWDIAEETLDDELPPLTLQPLVENSIVHGIAPRLQGGTISISARRDALSQDLTLSVRDDGAGCDPLTLERPRAEAKLGGIGLGALRRRFKLDYEGRARLQIHTAPGAGFRVDLRIPQSL